MKKLVLIDGNALVHRAFHALPPLTSPKGVVTNAVFGFSSILMKMMRELKPDYIAATFDLAGPTFRHEEFAEYKAKRVKAPQELYDQLALVKQVVEAFGIPIYEKQGYEADDLIGTLATRAGKEKNTQVVIATGDLDTLQLVVGEKIVVFTLRKGMSDTMIYDEKAVRERYGLEPAQLSDYRGLKGDPSDNIPGVPGIGEKTASQLIQQFGNLEKLYAALEKKELPEGISEKLKEKLVEFKDQAFFSRQLSQVVCDLDVNFSLEKTQWRKYADVNALAGLFKEFGFQSLVKRLDEIKLTDTPGDETASESQLETTSSSLMIATEKGLIGHDLKKSAGGDKKLLFDTKIAAYMLNIAVKNYEFPEVYYAEFSQLPAGDSAVKELAEHLGKRLDASGLRKPFEEIEMPLIPVLSEMERAGIKVDTIMLEKLRVSTVRELARLEKEIYTHAGGSEFNINSPAQLGDVLFNRLGLKGKVRKTGGGALSTAAPELEKLRDEHPIIDVIMQYRELQKLKTTYIEPFPSLVAADGRVHTTYNQTGTATGRLSSQDPNLQNIPVRTELGREFRKAFVAEDGFRLVSCDYSQIELRMVAQLAQDETMIAAFNNGEDIHTRTAAEIFGVAPSEVTKDMRRQAKVLNFGILYGMGTLGFARAAGVSRPRASEFIEKYFTEFSGVRQYMENSKNRARRQGYLDTLFGHRRYFPDINSTMPAVRAQAERMAINMPVQGTAADVVKMAMIKVHAFLHDQKLTNDAKMLLQVHDELVFEIREDKVKEIALKIKQIMESVHAFDVPLIVDVKAGKTWEDVEPLIIQ